MDDPKVRRRDEGIKFYLAVPAPAERANAAFSSLKISQVRGPMRQVRSGKLNGDHAGLFKLRLTGPRDRIDSKLVEKESY